MIEKTQATPRDYDIVRYPVVTEKSTMLLEKANAYVFVVDKHAAKPEIKGAIEKIFGVKVVSVNTIVNNGKRKVFRGRRGKRADFKKAIVRLAEGNVIELSAGV
ncbi:MAG: 50S ribosomal protein L23 [Holosporales bacterium]|jgi:large subunit ribosomal protein L23|nr:50S ribosomal protein L23 [Holosporales bacterium]